MPILPYTGDAWDQQYVAPELTSTKYNYKLVSNKLGFGVYSFPLFSRKFCSELVQDLEQYSGWTENRHDRYPTNDVLLKNYSASMHGLYLECLKNLIIPAVNKLFVGSTFDSEELNEETFIARYRPDIQSGLDLHHDESVFTAVTTISAKADYSGGGTFFEEQQLTVRAEAGHVLLHPGKLTHRHGARPVTNGTRYVIVSFCKFRKAIRAPRKHHLKRIKQDAGDSDWTDDDDPRPSPAPTELHLDVESSPPD